RRVFGAQGSNVVHHEDTKARSEHSVFVRLSSDQSSRTEFAALPPSTSDVVKTFFFVPSCPRGESLRIGHEGMFKSLRPLAPSFRRYWRGFALGGVSVLLHNGIWVLFP